MRTLKKIVIGYVLFNLVLAGLFLSAGGLQMLAKPKIPPIESTTSLAADLKYFQQIVLANEKGITPQQATEFTQIIERASSPQTVDELTLIVLRALSIFDNAHTTALTTKMYRLPVRFHWTANGLIIVKARPDYSTLLGHRIVTLGGKTPEALLPKSAILTGGGTESWRKYRSEFLFSAPSALALLGSRIDDGAVQIQTESPDKVHTTIRLRAEADLKPGDPFWEFRNAFPEDEHFETDGWVSALSKTEDLPLYLQETEKLHLLRDMPSHDAIYVRMNASFADKNESLEHFEQRIIDLANADNAKNVIVDFRFNRGGDYTKALPIVRTIADTVPANGRIYLIVGPNTFSAGIIAASQFKHLAPEKLVVVGSEVGDKLRFRAEGFYPKLPTSGVQLYLTKGWTDLANGCGWFDDCWPPNKLLISEIGQLEIDIPAENTWESYLAGEDLVIEAVIEHIENQRSLAKVSATL
ncbi:hypothetical protein [Microbulbifer elongatus]|uniref:hypothetical protein n=1 Tax=Microbulbifer elongatus TaxID=86173 RepID=UPI001E594D1D|nr:hypothetical protein [Microbulbifer elongatus]